MNLNKKSLSNIVICGDINDFNLAELNINHKWTNVVTSPTRGNNLLDVILVDDTLLLLVSSCEIYSPLLNSDHNVVVLKSDREITKISHSQTFLDYRWSNSAKFIDELSQVNWLPLYSSTDSDVNKKTHTFYSLL